MDLVTLVAACALTAAPKVMHALIWHQSGGEPWSFSVIGDHQSLVYRSAGEAVREAQTAVPQGVAIRIGLTGLAAESTSATGAMFMRCPNISMRRGRSVSWLTAAGLFHPSRPIRSAVPSPRIVALGTVLTISSRMRWRHRRRMATRPISTCRTTPMSDQASWCPRPALLVSTLPRRLQAVPMISSEAGRVHCFRRGRSRPAVFRPAPARSLRMQIGCKSRASWARIRRSLDRLTTDCSCADCPSGGRND